MRIAWVVMLASCSPSSTPDETPKQPTSPPVVPPAPLVVDAAPEVVPPDVPELDDVPTGDARIDGAGGIQVHVKWDEDTGTTHVATHLEITAPHGKLDLASKGDEDQDPLPLIERILPAGDQRWVLLGWTSPGEGMQTEHAWLVDGTKTLQIVDKLAWTTDRAHAGIAVDPTRSPPEIGIPLPRLGKDPDDDGLHNATAWELGYGSKHLTLAAVKKLPATTVKLATLPAYYTPPAQDVPTKGAWVGQFVWFETKTGFLPRR
ncbi:MAG TPA: hypothetical protein VGM90_00710 [Kofleriaceae bacterium]|jgi:hypothetical protein